MRISQMFHIKSILKLLHYRFILFYSHICVDSFLLIELSQFDPCKRSTFVYCLAIWSICSWHAVVLYYYYCTVANFLLIVTCTLCIVVCIYKFYCYNAVHFIDSCYSIKLFVIVLPASAGDFSKDIRFKMQSTSKIP